MPTPAGSGMTRRSMLLGGGRDVPHRLRRRQARASTRSRRASPRRRPARRRRVIVTIFLAGGIDGMSVLAPIADPDYQAHAHDAEARRPPPRDPLTGYDALRWHQKASALKALHDANKVTIFPAISYDHPNQSHFTSRHFYEVGALDPAGLDRLARAAGSTSSADVNNPIQGLSLGGAALARAGEHEGRRVGGRLAERLRLPEPRRLGLRRRDGDDRLAASTISATRRRATPPSRRRARRTATPRCCAASSTRRCRRARSSTRRTTASRATSRASPSCCRRACRSAPARCRATAGSTRTPTRSRASATTSSPTASRSRPSSSTSSSPASRTAS